MTDWREREKERTSARTESLDWAQHDFDEIKGDGSRIQADQFAFLKNSLLKDLPKATIDSIIQC